VVTAFVHVRILDVLYVFLSFVVVTPAVELLTMQWRRRRLCRRLGQERGSAVVTLIHRLETATYLGLPVARWVAVPQTHEVVAALRQVAPGVPVDLIVHVPSGVALGWGEIAAAVRERGGVTLVVPQYALSGGGQLAAAAARLVVGEAALIGPWAAGDEGHETGARERGADVPGPAVGVQGLAAAGLSVSTEVPEAAHALLRLCPQPPRGGPTHLFFGRLPRTEAAETAPQEPA
jgi:hypothetical protein